MNKDRVIESIKHYLPEIIIIGCAVAGAIAIATILSTTDDAEMQLDLTADDIRKLSLGGGKMRFETPERDFIVTYAVEH